MDISTTTFSSTVILHPWTFHPHVFSSPTILSAINPVHRHFYCQTILTTGHFIHWHFWLLSILTTVFLKTTVHQAAYFSLWFLIMWRLSFFPLSHSQLVSVSGLIPSPSSTQPYAGACGKCLTKTWNPQQLQNIHFNYRLPDTWITRPATDLYIYTYTIYTYGHLASVSHAGCRSVQEYHQRSRAIKCHQRRFFNRFRDPA